MGGRDQRGTVRGGALAHLHPRARAAPARGDGRARRRGRSSARSLKRRALRRRGTRRPHVSSARPELVASGELVLLTGARGRGNTNAWHVRPAEVPEQRPSAPPRRVAPPPRARPLLAAVVDGAGADELVLRGVRVAGPRASVSGEKGPVPPGISPRKGGQDATASPPNCPVPPGVSPETSRQDWTLSSSRLPKAGRKAGRKGGRKPGGKPGSQRARGKESPEPQNRGPPTHLKGGARLASMTVEQMYVTERGRRRRRMVRVDLDEVRQALGPPTAADRAHWQEAVERLIALLEPGSASGQGTR